MLSKVVNSKSQRDLMTNILMFIIYVIITAFIFRFIWNRALVPHVTVLTPVKTLFESILLALGISLLK